MSRIPCSVPILTLNAREHLAQLLPVLQEVCEDVFIVDGNSTDGTVELAQSLGVRVERQSADPTPNQTITDFTAARLRSWSLARFNWILVVDADELPTPELLNAVREIVYKNDSFIATRFHRLARLPDGRTVTHALFYPEHTMVRLFHRGAGVTLVPHRNVHERFHIPSNVRVDIRPEAFVHTWPSPHVFRQKLKRYATMEYSGGVRKNWFRWVIWYNLWHAGGQFARALWTAACALFQGGTVLPWPYTWAFIAYRFDALKQGLRNT